MKVYIAKDWTGSKIFAEPPKLVKCGGLPDIWTGHRLNYFDVSNSFTEDEIPKGKYIEKNIWWSYESNNRTN